MYTFTEDELQKIQSYVAKGPDLNSAIMPALWIAQEKFGRLIPETMQLVADTLEVPYPRVYRRAVLYTMDFEKKMPQYLFVICTCFSCIDCGANEILKYVKEHLETDDKGFSKDGKFCVREADCLDECETAPVAEISNCGYVRNLTKEKVLQTFESLRVSGELPS